MPIKTKENQKLIELTIKPYIDKLETEYDLNLSCKIFKISISQLTHYYMKYIKLYGVVSKDNKGKIIPYKVESYKILSWYGFILYNLTKNINCLNVAIIYLNNLLYIDKGQQFDNDFLAKLLWTSLNDNTDNNNFAIGKNGLYMVFKSAVVLLKDIKEDKKDDRF
jgi:hypothetical protein